MNLHLNPFEKNKIKKEEEKRRREEEEIENEQLQKMFEKLTEMQNHEKRDHINAGSAQVLASSAFKGVIAEDPDEKPVVQKRYSLPEAFIEREENPDFVINESMSGKDEHDFLIFGDHYLEDEDGGLGETSADAQKRLVTEIKRTQSVNIDDFKDAIAGSGGPSINNDNDTRQQQMFLKSLEEAERKVNEDSASLTSLPEMDVIDENENTKYKLEDENDYTSIDENPIPLELTEEWKNNLKEKVNDDFEDVYSEDFSDINIEDVSLTVSEFDKRLNKSNASLVEKELKKAISEGDKMGKEGTYGKYKNDVIEDDFDYNDQAFGKQYGDTVDFEQSKFMSETLQPGDAINNPGEIIDFFEIDKNDLAFAMHLITGGDGESKLKSRTEMLKSLKDGKSSFQVLGIIGNNEYLSDAYFDIKKQLAGCDFIHLNMRKTFMYNSPILFVTKHLISQLPKISNDDKKILWKRCANLLSATKFVKTRHSEELIFDRELALADPITNIKRELTKVFNAYDLNKNKFIVYIDETRGIDAEQFLNCISYITLVFENLPNFKLVFAIDSSFIKINAKSTQLKLGLAMIDYFSAQNKIMIETKQFSGRNNNQDTYAYEGEISDTKYTYDDSYVDDDYTQTRGTNYQNEEYDDYSDTYQSSQRPKRGRSKTKEYYESDYDDEDYGRNRKTRTNRGMEIRPINIGNKASRQEMASDTLEYSEVKPAREQKRVFGRMSYDSDSSQSKRRNEIEPPKKRKQRLLGQDDTLSDEEDNDSAMVRDNSGYRFKRQEYVSSYVKNVDALNRDEVEDILNKTRQSNNNEGVGKISIKANLARKKSQKFRFEDQYSNKEGKFSKGSEEDDFSQFIKSDTRRKR